MNKIIICAAALLLSACSSNNGTGEGQQLTKKSDNSNCRMVRTSGSKVAKKVCSGGEQRSTKSD